MINDSTQLIRLYVNILRCAQYLSIVIDKNIKRYKQSKTNCTYTKATLTNMSVAGRVLGLKLCLEKQNFKHIW